MGSEMCIRDSSSTYDSSREYYDRLYSHVDIKAVYCCTWYIFIYGSVWDRLYSHVDIRGVYCCIFLFMVVCGIRVFAENFVGLGVL